MRPGRGVRVGFWTAAGLESATVRAAVGAGVKWRRSSSAWAWGPRRRRVATPRACSQARGSGPPLVASSSSILDDPTNTRLTPSPGGGAAARFRRPRSSPRPPRPRPVSPILTRPRPGYSTTAGTPVPEARSSGQQRRGQKRYSGPVPLRMAWLRRAPRHGREAKALIAAPTASWSGARKSRRPGELDFPPHRACRRAPLGDKVSTSRVWPPLQRDRWRSPPRLMPSPAGGSGSSDRTVPQFDPAETCPATAPSEGCTAAPRALGYYDSAGRWDPAQRVRVLAGGPFQPNWSIPARAGLVHDDAIGPPSGLPAGRRRLQPLVLLTALPTCCATSPHDLYLEHLRALLTTSSRGRVAGSSSPTALLERTR